MVVPIPPRYEVLRSSVTDVHVIETAGYRGDPRQEAFTVHGPRVQGILRDAEGRVLLSCQAEGLGLLRTTVRLPTFSVAINAQDHWALLNPHGSDLALRHQTLTDDLHATLADGLAARGAAVESLKLETLHSTRPPRPYRVRGTFELDVDNSKDLIALTTEDIKNVLDGNHGPLVSLLAAGRFRVRDEELASALREPGPDTPGHVVLH